MSLIITGNRAPATATETKLYTCAGCDRKFPELEMKVRCVVPGGGIQIWCRECRATLAVMRRRW